MLQLTTSMVDLKTEEARLNVKVAQNEYATALAGSSTIDDIIVSANLTRALIMKLTNCMGDTLLAAVDNCFDETRLHYLMTDCMLDLMRELANEIGQVNYPLPVFADEFKRGVKPKDLLSVSQWADRNRYLSSGTNQPGQWVTSRTPHLKDIMDDFSVHSPVEQITFMKSSGVGGTEALYNMLGYVMDHVQNKDVMAVVPTLELRDRSLNMRIERLINETPALAHINVTSKKKSTNRADVLEFSPVGRLIKTGANSDEAARMDHVAYLLGDEIASWKSSSGEGDRIKLFKNRLRTMTRSKIFFVSTPVQPDDYVVREFNEGDQRYRYVPCPHCGEYQTLEFGGKDKPYGLKWSLSPTSIEGERIVKKAWFVCKANACVIEESHKDDMLDKGKWIPTYPHRTKHHSYHINAFYIKNGLGWNWVRIAQEFLNSLGDTDEQKTFEQTTLGLPWVDKGDAVDPNPLMLRKETYAEKPWLKTTGFVDVQKDRLELGIEGWFGHIKSTEEKNGLRTHTVVEENWKIDYIIIPGDTAQSAVWEELAATLKLFDLDKLGVDSGYNTSMVYDFVAKHPYAVATKGVAGARPLIEDEKRRKQMLRTKRKKGVPVYPLGVDQGKAIISSRLKNVEPGAGYVHFSDDSAFDDEYFLQLTAEHLVQRKKKNSNRVYYEWVLQRPRNEALDIAVGNLAMIKLLSVDWQKIVVKKVAPSTNRLPTALVKKSNPFTKEEDW
jgi:phage terminase large subunit GpA-like protein